ncbi:hypothetical protein [Aminipila terrae]
MTNKVEICGVNTAKLPVYKDAEMMKMIEAVKGEIKRLEKNSLKGISD